MLLKMYYFKDNIYFCGYFNFRIQAILVWSHICGSGITNIKTISTLDKKLSMFTKEYQFLICINKQSVISLQCGIIYNQ